MAASRPGVLDYLDLCLLRLAKLRRAKPVRVLPDAADYMGIEYSQVAARMDAAGFEILLGYPQMTAFWRGYHYVYVAFRAFEMLVRKTVRRDFVFLDTGFYRWVALRVQNHAARREPLDDADSTFVLCRRAQSAGEAPA